MTKKSIVFIIPLISFLSLSSCGNKEKNKNLSLVNISDAKSLFIGSISSPNSTSKKVSKKAVQANADGESKHLLKMTEDGFVEEVVFTYIDDNGKEHTETSVNCPEWIKDVNDDYIYISFTRFGGPSSSSYNYLVNKTTNRAYKLPNTYAFDSYFCNGVVNTGMIPREEVFPSFSKDSFYVLTEDGNFVNKIAKVDISNPDNITSKFVSAANDNPANGWRSSFAVDLNGNLAYSGTDSNGGDVVRFVTPNGLVKNIPISNYNGDFWQGYDGYIYAKCDDQGINKITLENNELKFTKYGNNDVETHADWTARGSYASQRLYLKKQQKIINVIFSKGISEIYNKESEPIFTPFSDMSTQFRSIKCVASSDDYVYVSGQLMNGDPVIAKIDVNNSQYVITILTTSLYDASSMSVDDDENVSFCGLSMMSGAVVVGTISNSGEVKVSETHLNDEIDSFVEVSIN